MAKRKKPASESTAAPILFLKSESPRRRRLFLRRFLADEADKVYLRGPQQDEAHRIIKHWAKLEAGGHLAKKETSLDAEFLHEVFGKALGYRTATESPEEYELEREFAIPGGQSADGALGNFQHGTRVCPLVVIELKGARVDLDRDKFNGRTPVQQCWDYLDSLPDCLWGIVSNFVTFRLYHRGKTPQAYEEFRLRELRDLKTFRQFYYIFQRGGLVRPCMGRPLRAPALLERSESRQRAVGDELYETYSANRYRLIEHLHFKLGNPLEKAIHIAQKILDRIIFIAFCEDRELLPEKCIDTAYRNLPPFSKVTNPRWRNFLDLFQAIDKGNAKALQLEAGYNGGLFRHDPDVDDLQLDDEWTDFFRTIGTYDFRDEVNVDVLGHIFEKSVAELEKLRTAGLFSPADKHPAPHRGEAAMRKSAQRKRFGIYYTPPDFTRFIVDNTVARVVEERLAQVRRRHKLKADQVEADRPSPALAAYWRDSFDALRRVKVCDPACGSGAFLIQAYVRLEHEYQTIVDRLVLHDGEQAEAMADTIPDIILRDNLYGVDLSPQAVEITQLALWVWSARRGKTLADLSRNIVHGNSLVSDAAADPAAMTWASRFPDVFSRAENPGFDCVIGNPPWERLKLQEREFFALSAPDIAGAVSAAKRRTMIAELENANPELYARYLQAKRSADAVLGHVRTSGNFPLTAKGDINTYMVFAELARSIVAPNGRVGLLVPSGIASDKTTKDFFNKLMDSKSLISLYDFENKAPVFPDVHRSFKFCTLVFGGSRVRAGSTDFVFFARRMEDLDDKSRHIALSKKDLALVNPNTRTCPIFRSQRDAELTKAIYRRVPILIDQSRAEGGNPWGVRFFTMFHQTNDAELFHTQKELQQKGFKPHGNAWRKGDRTFLPLYEAKMVQAYDHRAAGVVVERANWFRQGQTEQSSLVAHQNPEYVVQPRWWADSETIERSLGTPKPPVLLVFKNVTSPTNRRTMIATVIPAYGVINSAPIIRFPIEIGVRLQACFLANLNAFVLDYVARQKIGNVNLNFFLIEQFPMFPPDRYADRCPWDKRRTLETWISDRVLKLTCTANDVRPLAEAAGFEPPVHKWNPAERAEIAAELDAAFFLLYGVGRDDARYILSTFTGPRRTEEMAGGLFRMDRSILDAYDRLSGRS